MQDDEGYQGVLADLIAAVRESPPPPKCPISLRVEAIVAALRRNKPYEWNLRVPHFRVCSDCQRELQRFGRARGIKMKGGHPVFDALCIAGQAICGLVIYENSRNNRR